VPDPTGTVNGNVVALTTVDSNAVSTLTHNLEHLTNVAIRATVAGTLTTEDAWLDEGLADIATELAFYSGTGLTPRSNIQLSTLTGGPAGTVEAFNVFAAPNFKRLGLWLQHPDTTGAFLHSPSTDTTPSGNLAARGALWAFLRYAADRVGGSEPAFWASLMNTTDHGLSNLQTAIGGNDPQLWARDFSAAMYADDAIAGIPAQYTNPSWNYRSVFSGVSLGGFNLLTRALPNNTPVSVVTNFGGTSFLRFGVPTAGFGTVKTTVGGSAPGATFAMTIIRTQ
jgi:hypothetical protein